MTKMREADVRAAEIRKHRALHHMENVLDVPPGVTRDGFSYYNFRVDIKGYVDHRVEEAAAQGWELVKTSRSPHTVCDPLSRVRYPNHVTRGDSILAEIPTVIKEEIDAAHNKRSTDKENSLRAQNISIIHEAPSRIVDF